MIKDFDFSQQQPNSSFKAFQQASKVTIFASNPSLIKTYQNLYTTSSRIRGVSLQSQKGTYYNINNNYEAKQYSLKEILQNKREIEIISEGSFLGQWIYFNNEVDQTPLQQKKSPIKLAQILLESLDLRLEQVKIIFNASGTGIKANKSNDSFISHFAKTANGILNKKIVHEQVNLEKIIVQGRSGIVSEIDRNEIIPVNLLEFMEKKQNKNSILYSQLFNIICQQINKNAKIPEITYLKDLLTRQHQTQAKQMAEQEQTAAIQTIYSVFRTPYQILDPQQYVIRNPKSNVFETIHQQKNIFQSTSGPLGKNYSIKNFMKFQKFDQVKQYLTQEEIQASNLEKDNPKYLQLQKKIQDFQALRQQEIRLIPFVVQGKLRDLEPHQIVNELLKNGKIGVNNTIKVQTSIKKLCEIIRSPNIQEIMIWKKYRSISKLKLDESQLQRLVQIFGQNCRTQLQKQLQIQYFNQKVKNCTGPQDKQYYLTPKQKSILNTLKELMLQKETKQIAQKIFQQTQNKRRRVVEATEIYTKNFRQRSLRQGFKLLDTKYKQFCQLTEYINQYQKSWPQPSDYVTLQYNQKKLQYSNAIEDLVKIGCKAYHNNLDDYYNLEEWQRQSFFDYAIANHPNKQNQLNQLQKHITKYQTDWPKPEQHFIDKYVSYKNQYQLLIKEIIFKGYQSHYNSAPDPTFDYKSDQYKDYFNNRGLQELMPNYMQHNTIQKQIKKLSKVKILDDKQQQKKLDQLRAKHLQINKKLKNNPLCQLTFDQIQTIKKIVQLQPQINYLPQTLNEQKQRIDRICQLRTNKIQIQRKVRNLAQQSLTNNQIQTQKDIKQLKKTLKPQLLKEIKNLYMNNYSFQTDFQLLNHYHQQRLTSTANTMQKRIVPSQFKSNQLSFLNKIIQIKQQLAGYKFKVIDQSSIKSIHYNQGNLLRNLQKQYKLTQRQIRGMCFAFTELYRIQNIKNIPMETILEKFKALETFSKILADQNFPYKKLLPTMSDNQKQICRDYTKMKQNFKEIFDKIKQVQNFNVGSIYKNQITPPQFDGINWQIQNQKDHTALLNAMKQNQPYKIGIHYETEVGRMSGHSVGIVKRGPNNFEYFDCNHSGTTGFSMEQVNQKINHTCSGYNKYNLQDIYSRSSYQQYLHDSFKIIDEFHNSFKSLAQNISFQNQLIKRNFLGNVEQHTPCTIFSDLDLKHCVSQEKQAYTKDKHVLVVSMEGDQVCTKATKNMMKRYNKKAQLMLLNVPGLEKKSIQWNQNQNKHEILPVLTKSQEYSKLDIKIIGHGVQNILDIGGQKFTLGNKTATEIVQKIKTIIQGKKANALKIDLVGCKSGHIDMAYKVANHLQQFAQILQIKKPGNVQLKAYKHIISVTQTGKTTPYEIIKKLQNEKTAIKLVQFKGHVIECGTPKESQKNIDDEIKKMLQEKKITQQQYDKFKAIKQRYSSIKKNNPQQIFAQRYYIQDKMFKMKDVVDREMEKQHNTKFKEMIPDFLSFQKVNQGYKMKFYSKQDQSKYQQIIIPKTKEIQQWHLAQICEHQSFRNMNISQASHNSLSVYYLYQGLVGLWSQLHHFNSVKPLDYVNLVTNSLQTAAGIADLVKKGLLTFPKTFTKGTQLHNLLVMGKAFPNIMRVVNSVANLINLWSLYQQYQQQGSPHGIIIAQMMITGIFLIFDIVEICTVVFSLAACSFLGPLGLLLGFTMIILGLIKSDYMQQNLVNQKWNQCKRKIYEIIKPIFQEYPIKQKNEEGLNLNFMSGAPITMLDFQTNIYRFGRILIDNMTNANGTQLWHYGSTFDDTLLRQKILWGSPIDLYKVAGVKQANNRKIQQDKTEQKNLIIYLPAKPQLHLHQKFGGEEAPEDGVGDNGVKASQLSIQEKQQCQQIFSNIQNNCNIPGDQKHNMLQPFYKKRHIPQNKVGRIFSLLPTSYALYALYVSTEHAKMTSIEVQRLKTSINVTLGDKDNFFILPQNREDSEKLIYNLQSSKNHYNINLMGNLNKLTLNLISKKRTTWSISISEPINVQKNIFQQNFSRPWTEIASIKIASQQQVEVFYNHFDKITFLLHLNDSVIEKIAFELEPQSHQLTVVKIIGVNLETLYKRYRQFYKNDPRNALYQFYKYTGNVIKRISKQFRMRLPLRFTVGNKFCSIQQRKDKIGFLIQIPLQMNEVQMMLNDKTQKHYLRDPKLEKMKKMTNVPEQFKNRFWIFICSSDNGGKIIQLLGNYAIFIDLNYQVNYVLSAIQKSITYKQYHILNVWNQNVKKLQVFQDNYDPNLPKKSSQYYSIFKSLLQSRNNLQSFKRIRQTFNVKHQFDQETTFQYKLLNGNTLFKHFKVTCQIQHEEILISNIEIYQRPQKQLGIIGQLYQVLDQKPYYTINTLLDQFQFSTIPKLADANEKLNVVVDFANCSTTLANILLNFQLQYKDIILTVFKKQQGNINLLIDQKYSLEDFIVKVSQESIEISLLKLKKKISKVTINFNRWFQMYNCFISIGKYKMVVNQFIKKAKIDEPKHCMLMQQIQPSKQPANLKNLSLLFYRIAHKSKIEKILIDPQQDIHKAISEHMKKSLKGKQIIWKGQGYLHLNMKQHNMKQGDIVTVHE